MHTTRHVLQLVEVVVFSLLGVVAYVRWRRAGGRVRALVAATFVDLGAVVVVGYLLGSHPGGFWGGLAERLLVAALAFFPFLLFRFTRSFATFPKWFDVGAVALTVVSAVGPFAFRHLPATGERWPTGWAVYVAVFVFDWTLLSAVIAVALWRGGAGQPTVTRRRMRTLALGAVGLAIALVLAGTGGSGRQSDTSQVVIEVLAVLSGPLFLVGFAPPAPLLAMWRRPEMDELRAAEAALVASQTPEEVGASLVRHVARILGGRGAVLVDRERTVIGAHGMTPPDAAALASGRDDVIAGTAVVRMPLRSGELAIVGSPATPYFGRQEAELIHTITAMIDLALIRSRASAQERRVAEELAATNQAMREFVAIASHDLRTPIAVIKGLATMVGEEGEQARRAELTSAICRQADHLAVIVDDLLLTSRLDAGVVAPEPVELDVAPVVCEVASDLGMDVAVDAPPTLRCRTDPDHFRRMLVNYLQNARNYGAPPYEVHARATTLGVEVRVCDRGPGLSADFIPRAFEKFARQDPTTSQQRMGTGLGLSIVRGLARIDGGDAWYEPNTPVGACFALRLPGVPEPSDD